MFLYLVSFTYILIPFVVIRFHFSSELSLELEYIGKDLGTYLRSKNMKDNGYNKFQKRQLRSFANRVNPKGSPEFLPNSWHCSDKSQSFCRTKQLVRGTASLHNLCAFAMEPINTRKFLYIKFVVA